MANRLQLFALSMVVAAALTGLVCVNAKAKTEQRIYKEVASSTVAAVKPVPKRIPLALLKIAYCESGNRQFLADGSVVKGPDGHDHGRWQIRETVHRAEAIRHGWDIDTAEGNKQYALFLYKNHGTSPWYSSAHCWQSITELRKKGYNG